MAPFPEKTNLPTSLQGSIS